MNHRSLVACLVAAVTVSALSGFAYGQPAGTAAPTAVELNAKITIARNLQKEAQVLTDDATRGKTIDKSQPVAAGEKPKLKDLSEDERKAAFLDAGKKFDDADKKVAEVITLLKKYPNVIADPTPVKNQIDVAHASALVKNVRFLRDHKIGKPQEWLTLAQKAVTLDKTNSEAQPLVVELKAMIAATEKKAAPTPTKGK